VSPSKPATCQGTCRLRPTLRRRKGSSAPLGEKGHRQVDAKQLARKLKVQNNRSIAAAAVKRGLQEQKVMDNSGGGGVRGGVGGAPTIDALEQLPTNLWPGFEKFRVVQARLYPVSQYLAPSKPLYPDVCTVGAGGVGGGSTARSKITTTKLPSDRDGSASASACWGQWLTWGRRRGAGSTARSKTS